MAQANPNGFCGANTALYIAYTSLFAAKSHSMIQKKIKQ